MLAILPNLSALKIGVFSREGWLNHLVLFLHDGIRSFNLSWFFRIQEGDQTLDTLFDDITDWAPLISELIVSAGRITESVDSSIAKLLSRLPHLETLRTNPYLLQQSVLNALASLQNLQTVQLTQGIRDYHETKYQMLNTNNAFPRLKILPLCGDLESICILLRSPNAFQNLLELNIRNEGEYELVHLHSLFDLIPHASPLLRRLTMTCNLLRGPVIGSVYSETLRPLTSLFHLEMLELESIRPIKLTTNQMVDIFGKCSCLTTLTLNTTLSAFSTLLTLDVLRLLSEACPQLVKLGLHVDARVIPSTPDLLHVHGFRNLRVLDLRTSPIHDPGCASLYLSRIIPSQCTLVVHSPHEMADEEVGVFFERWKEVKRLLPFFIQSHEDSQKAIRALRQERDELRAMLACRSRALGTEATATCHQI
ncbi:hypothetical protein DFH11DRAFT_367404 [Phellopilus nigrolimitatus]|nr:hypothetical protein DFH11DRAFT_367404 [Phellopilus nigrolimitatus]